MTLDELAEGEPSPVWQEVQRYAEAVGATRQQQTILARIVMRSADGLKTVTAAADATRVLTLDDLDAMNRGPLSDGEAYVMAFGQGPNLNTFAIPRATVADLVAEAVKRGSPITAEERARVSANIRPGVTY